MQFEDEHIYHIYLSARKPKRNALPALTELLHRSTTPVPARK